MTDVLRDIFELAYEGLTLFRKKGHSSPLLYRHKLFIIETYKSFHHMNAEFVYDLLKFNNTAYDRK